MNGLVVDDFAGAGGWDVGLRLAGFTGQVVGYEWDHAACRTAVAAGHARVRCDIAEAPSWPLAGKVDGYLSSPPCQAWSSAGKGGGQQDQPRIFAHLATCIGAGVWVEYPRNGWHDDRSPLVLEVVRRIDGLRPRWVACEQVPEVLPFWREVARWLRGQGYSAWCGILNSADYGVPQTRRRAILVARRDGITATSPESTHSREGGDDLFGSTERWVSMAEALGWDGAALHQTRGAGMLDRHGARPDREMDQPAFTITAGSKGSGPRMEWMLKRDRGEGLIERWGDREGRGLDQPSFSVTAGTGGVGTRMSWVMRNGPQENACERSVDEPAGTVYCSRPGNLNWVKDRAGGESQFDQESVRVTVQEAGILQSFPADYPWTGTKTQQYQQAGNAIPPLLAAAIVAPLLAELEAVAA